MNCEITSVDGAVLYTAEIPDDTPERLRTCAALEQAAECRANLSGAYLGGAGPLSLRRSDPRK